MLRADETPSPQPSTTTISERDSPRNTEVRYSMTSVASAIFAELISLSFLSIYSLTLALLSNLDALTLAVSSFTLGYAALYAFVALQSIKYSSANLLACLSWTSPLSASLCVMNAHYNNTFHHEKLHNFSCKHVISS